VVLFGVLGPLEVRADGDALAIRGAKERLLLALLLSRANSVVSVGDIIEALWETGPPRSAVKSVQVYVVRLRNALEPQGRSPDRSLVMRRGAGYLLHAERDQVDALRFADLAEKGRSAAAAGAHGLAAGMFREALGLWRGASYADFRDTRFGSMEAARLDEMRLAVLEARIEADLAMGRHAEVIGELEGLVHQYPLRERFWAQLMLALYRGGRQSDALLVFRRARGHLVEEMGVEPGSELRELEAAVLAQAPSLTLASAAMDHAPELPRSLARAGPAFVGRDRELSVLRAWWTDTLARHGGVVAVAGPTGSGRTRLVAELANLVHARGAVVHGFEELAQARGKIAEPADLVTAANGRPVLAVLDDVDLRGEDALSFLEASAGTAPDMSLLVVATYDPVNAGARLEAIERGLAPRRLYMGPLGDADAALIVQRYLGTSAGTEAVQRIVGEGHGLPGRLHELAALWVEEDAARRVNAAAQQAPAARQALSLARAAVREGILELQRARDEQAARMGPGKDGDWAALCPYKGLARFEKRDAAIFYGREALIAALVARLSDTSLIAVAGPSGAGKSSVIRAGLLPALASGVLPGSEQWRQYIASPGRTPRKELAELTETPPAAGAVLVIDQFEELFTTCDDEDERRGFVSDLLSLCDSDAPPNRVLLSVRADFLGRCAAYPDLAARLGEGTVLVGPMTEQEVRRAVEGPARYAGLSAEADLLDAVAADVQGRPGALPLLSTALLDAWERRRGRTLTHAGYLAAGGVSGAVSRLAESAFARLTSAGQEAARRILVRLAEPGEAGLAVRRRVPLEEVAAPGDAASAQALDLLVARRLLTIERAGVEITHEALLSHWPRLVRWLEEDEQGRVVRRHLAPTAREWAQSGRPEGELYRGARLASALDWAAGHADDFNAVEREFLDASRSAADRELREQRERADREARGRRRLRAAFAAVLVLLLLAAAVSGVAINQRSQARAAERSAEARRLGSRALTEPALDRSLLLAVEGVRIDSSLETDGDLLAALLRSPYALAQVRGDGDRLQDVDISQDGRIAVAGDNDGTLVFWDANTMRQLGRPLQRGYASPRLAFAPDSRRLAVMTCPTLGCSSWDVYLWDATTRRLLRRLPVPGPVNFTPTVPAWTRDGRTVATGSGTGVVFYDAATGRETGRIKIPGADPSLGVDPLSAGPDMVAIARNTQAAFVIDPKTARILRRVALPVPAFAMAVSPDGRTLGIGTAQGAVFSVDLTTGQARRASGQHTAAVWGMAFARDGRTAASTSDDADVMVWDVRTGQRLLTLQGHAGRVLAGVFAPDGRTFFSTGLDGSVIKWDVSGRRSFGVTVPGVRRGLLSNLAASQYTSVAWTGDRSRAVIGYPDGTVATIDSATGRVIALGKPMKELEDLAVSPDGRFAYLVSTDGRIRRWDTALGHADLTSTVTTAKQEECFVTVSPDGRTLAVSTCSYSNAAAAMPVVFLDASTLRRIGPTINLGYNPAVTQFSPDGRLLAVGNYGRPGLAIADARSGRVMWRTRSISEVTALGFSPDGRRLLAGTATGFVQTFDVASGRRLAGPALAAAGLVIGVSFAPDGRTIMTSSTDGTVRLWETAGLRPLGQPLPAATNEWVYAAFSPEGTRILALDPSGRVISWPATVQAWLHRACNIVRRGFTPYERTVYSISRQSPQPCG
jgi:DNA-binding SARP family transcriptional activator/WD40 repeat protein